MIPKYLYHYTSIDTLKKIIETKKIRFTRLDKLNDPYEGLVELEGNLSADQVRKCVYCSCWTDKQQESVNLWAIYTKLTMQGVRIKMKSTMFSKELILQEYNDGFIPSGFITPIKNFRYLATDPPTEINTVYGPFKVEYVETPHDTYKSALLSFSNPESTSDEISTHNILTKELGLKKVNHWEYENEWRYKIGLQMTIAGRATALNMIPSELIVSPDYIDVPLKTKIEEIIVGPNVTEEDSNELETFLKTYGIDLKIQKSAIKFKQV